MLYPLSSETLHLAAPLYRTMMQHAAIGAAFAGQAPADVYVDDPAAPRLGALLVGSHRVYLGGSAQDSSVLPELVGLLRDRFAGTADRICVIFYTSPDWAGRLSALEAVGEIKHGASQRYQRHLDAPLPAPALPAGFHLRPIDAALLAGTTLGNHQALIDEVHSEAPDSGFFLAHRFGHCVQYQQELVSWCLSEYNYDGCCEFGIETLPAHQRRGLAMTVAQATMATAQARGITTVGWQCRQENIPSSQLAQKLGFVLQEEYPALLCRFNRDA